MRVLSILIPVVVIIFIVWGIRKAKKSRLPGREKEKLASGDAPQTQEPPSEDCHELQQAASEDSYWFFLSYFWTAQKIEKDRYISSWSRTLGRPYTKVIEEFISKGLLVQAGLKEKLAEMLRAEDLKQLLNELGLKTSGNKDALLNRYIEVRPEEAGKKAATMVWDFFVCTPKGREKVKQQGHRRADAQDSAQQEMKNLLTRGKIDQAAEVVNIYMQSVQRPPQDNNWAKNDVKMVMEIKEAPGLTRAEVEEARVNTAIELLWYGQMKRLYYTRMPSFYQFARFAAVVIGKKRSQEQLRGFTENEFLTRVEIFCSDDSCRICKAVAKRSYPLKKAPILPIDGCTKSEGCHCSYTAMV